jgi:prevent-host-death family protein
MERDCFHTISHLPAAFQFATRSVPCPTPPPGRAAAGGAGPGLTNLTNSLDDGIVVGMEKVLNLYDAKTQLSALVEEAAAGAEIIIAKAGKPMAKLIAFRAGARRKPGRAKGLVWIGDDFDAPLPADLRTAFDGDAD